jgi:hypothetical protein
MLTKKNKFKKFLVTIFIIEMNQKNFNPRTIIGTHLG